MSGFSFGNKAGAPATGDKSAAVGGFGFGKTAATAGGGSSSAGDKPAAGGGFGFGKTGAAGAAAGSSSAGDKPAAGGGFGFGKTGAAGAAAGGGVAGATTTGDKPGAAAGGGFGFGNTAATTGGVAGATATGDKPGAAAGGGFGFGKSGTTTSTGFGSGKGTAGFGAANAGNELPPTADTPYSKLSQRIQKEIDEAYTYFIKPTSVALDEIKRYRPDDQRAGSTHKPSSGSASSISSLEALNASLRKASVAATRLDNKQKRLQHIANDLREEARRDFTDGRKYGQWALQQIRRHHQTQSSHHALGYNGVPSQQQQLLQYSQHQQQLAQYTMPGQGDASSSSSYPPLDFYLDVITRLEERLEKYADEIAQVDSQLMAAQGGRPTYADILSHYPSLNGSDSSTTMYGTHSIGNGQHPSAYGQRGRVGTEQLVELLQRQHAVFLQVAARVAETHEYCDSMRDQYLQHLRRTGGGDGNPFEAEDRKEAFEHRQQYRRAMQHPVDASILNAAAATGMGLTAGAAAAGGGGFGSTPGKTGFGSTTGGFGSPGKSGFGTNTGGGFGASPGKTGFGSTTGGFGSAGKSGFGTSAGGGFGASPGKTGFGSTTGGFGSAGKTGFGTSTGGGFGASSGQTSQGLGMGGGLSLDLGMPLDKPSLSRDKGAVGIKKKGFGR